MRFVFRMRDVDAGFHSTLLGAIEVYVKDDADGSTPPLHSAELHVTQQGELRLKTTTGGVQ